MTKISLIHGIGATATAAEAAAQRGAFDIVKDAPKKEATKRFYNYSAMTQGELELLLVDERLDMLKSYYGDPNGIYQQGRNLIYNALSGDGGLHSTVGVGFPTSNIPKELNGIVSHIRSARSQYNPAGKLLNTRLRPRIGMGFDVDALNIPLTDCIEWATGQVNPTGLSDREYERQIRILAGDCQEENAIIRVFNENLGKAAAHMLYEFIKNPNDETNLVAFKSLQHKQLAQRLTDISGLSRTVVRQWNRNGIMRENVRRLNPPFTPEETIAFLRQGDAAGIRLDPATIAIIKIIGKIIIAAIVGATTIVSVIEQTKQIRLKKEMADLGLKAFGPEAGDFEKGGDGNNEDESALDPTAIGLLGLGAYFLLS